MREGVLLTSVTYKRTFYIHSDGIVIYMYGYAVSDPVSHRTVSELASE